MPVMPTDSSLRAELRALGHNGQVASVRMLDGGMACGAWLVCFADGSRLVAKMLADGPADLFAAEAWSRPSTTRA